MGCYDSVIFKCPKCGTELEAQSKSGECELARYESTAVPPRVAHGLGTTVYCPECEKYFTIRSNMPAVVTFVLGPYKKENEDELW